MQNRCRLEAAAAAAAAVSAVAAVADAGALTCGMCKQLQHAAATFVGLQQLLLLLQHCRGRHCCCFVPPAMRRTANAEGPKPTESQMSGIQQPGKFATGQQETATKATTMKPVQTTAKLAQKVDKEWGTPPPLEPALGGARCLFSPLVFFSFLLSILLRFHLLSNSARFCHLLCSRLRSGAQQAAECDSGYPLL